MEKERFFIGKVKGTHGIKGELSIEFDPKRHAIWEHIDQLIFENDQKMSENDSKKSLLFPLKSYRFHKNSVLIQLNNCANINDVEFLKGYKVYANLTADQYLVEDEFYTSDLIGTKVFNQHGTLVGTVKDSISVYSGADNLVIENTLGQKRSVPFVKELFPKINLNPKEILVNDRPGLIFDEV